MLVANTRVVTGNACTETYTDGEMRRGSEQDTGGKTSHTQGGPEELKGRNTIKNSTMADISRQMEMN